MPRTRLIAGNWKMNGSRAANAVLVKGILEGLHSAPAEVELVVCPPAVYLDSVGAALRGSAINLGAQDLCEQREQGAFTGEIHGAMLREMGCKYVIVGHSERRVLYGEDNARVARKFATAQALGLTPILCVGETLQQHEHGQVEQTLDLQLDSVLRHCGISSFAQAVLAYEPVWAIGTGRTATPQHAQAIHAYLRGRLAGWNATIADSVRILYGGSVKPDNAAALFSCPDIDGGLVGGAALRARDFLAIATVDSIR